MANSLFLQREEHDEQVFWDKDPSAPIDVGFSSIFNLEKDTRLPEMKGRQLTVTRLRVVRREKNGQIVDPGKGPPDYYTDYYFREKTEKTQIVLHFTAGGLRGSLGVLTAGRHGKNPHVGVHFVLTTKGRILELVETEYWGHSSSAGDDNAHVVSIEIINPGPLEKRGNSYHLWKLSGDPVCEEAEAGEWIQRLEKPYRQCEYFHKFTPVQYERLRDLLAYIGAKHGIPLALLEDDNPKDPEQSRRYRCLHHTEAAHFKGIVSHVNYVNEGKWDIGPAFAWDEVLARKRVVFPFQIREEPIANPVAAYANNETHDGGAFVAGRAFNLHGGIHLFPDVDATPVRAMAPGAIIAARLVPADTPPDPQSLEFTGNYNGFVLVKHFVKVPEPPSGSGATPPAKPPLVIYSLYMHLACPRWSDPAGDRYVNVPWVRRLMRERNGAIVDLRPDAATFGELLWVRTEGLSRTAKKCRVFDPEKLTDIPFEIEGDRVNGFFKEPAPELDKGYKALKEGKIITFDEPFVLVDDGEAVGYVDQVSKLRLPPGQLHWEVFAPATGSGPSDLAKVVELAGDIKDRFVAVEDSAKDNHKATPADFKTLVEKGLGSEEKTQLDAALADKPPDHPAGDYAKDLERERQTNGKTFAAGFKTPPTEEGLFYPLDLEIAADSEHCAAMPSSCSLKVEFFADRPRDPKKDAPTGKVGEAILNLALAKGGKTTAQLAVPAAAATAVFSMASAFIDPATPPSAPTVATDLALLQNLMQFRRRNVRLKHLTEWSQQGLSDLFQKQPAGVEKFDLARVQQIAWWAPAQGEEVPILGGGKTSLFAAAPGPDGKQLPKEGVIEALHPVTACWLLHVLLKHDKASIARQTEIEGVENPEVLYRGWSSVTPAPEEILQAIAIRKDYSSSARARFLIECKELDLRLAIGESQYRKGVSRLAVRQSFWGAWELSLDPAGSTTPAGPTKIELPAPVLVHATMPEAVARSTQLSMRLQFSDDLPREMRGVVFFKCARVAAPPVPARGSPPAPEEPPAESSFVLCPKGIVASASEIAAEGVEYKSEGGYRFIVGPTKAGSREPYASPRMTVKSYREAFPAGQPFRVSVYLTQKVQQLLDLWDGRQVKNVSDRALHPASVADDGLAVTIRPSFRWSGTRQQRAAAEDAEFKALCDQAEALRDRPGEWIEEIVPDAANKLLRVAVKSPADVPRAGELLLTFDPRPLIDDFIRAAGAQQDDRVYVSAGFYGPNGGEYALADSAQYAPEADSVVALSDDVQKDLTGARLGVVAQPSGPSALLSFHNAAFTRTGYRMADGGLEIFAEGGGLPAMWRQIAVEASCRGHKIPCARKGTRFSALLRKKDLEKLGALGEDGVEFEFAIPQGSTIQYGSAPSPVRLNVKPALSEFRVVDPGALSRDDPTRQLFGELHFDQYVCLLGKAECMPTDASLQVKCVLGPDFKTEIPLGRDNLKFRHGRDGQGACDEEGNFTAWIARGVLRQKAHDHDVKFVWARSSEKGKVWERAVAPKESASFSVGP